MSTPAAPVPLWNIANVLTMVRCVMVPVFVVVAALYPESVGGRSVAAAIFVVAMITDFLDGYLARSRNLVKAMTGAAFIMLSVWDYVPWWMTILILLREFGITIMRFTILKYGALPANMAGKAKTMMQSIAITFCLLPFELWWSPARWIGLALVTIAFVLTIWSGLVNLKDGLRLRRETLSSGA